MKFETLDKEKVKLMQPLTLAMIGDSVHSLYVREYVARNIGSKVNKMNKLTSSVVNAGAQFRTIKKLESDLSEEEMSVVSRARNTHIHSKSKNFSVHEYIYATACEALLGYLYLTGQEDRLEHILKVSLEEMTND